VRKGDRTLSCFGARNLPDNDQGPRAIHRVPTFPKRKDAILRQTVHSPWDGSCLCSALPRTLIDTRFLFRTREGSFMRIEHATPLKASLVSRTKGFTAA
jgi:hypothetical protein